MRRRLIKLVALGLIVPAAGKAASMAADRLEADHGPTTLTRGLRRAGGLTAQVRRLL
ncbi:MAG: hypothetical protein ACYC1D_11000 [Acidimicrobiales bacterium]